MEAEADLRSIVEVGLNIRNLVWTMADIRWLVEAAAEIGAWEARAELKILVEAVADIRSLMAVMAEVGGLVEAGGNPRNTVEARSNLVRPVSRGNSVSRPFLRPVPLSLKE